MKQFCFAVPVSVAVISGLLARPGLAHDPTEILAYFHLLPQSSTLDQLGGGGLDLRYEVSGAFILRYGNTSTNRANFEIAPVWGSLPAEDPDPPIVISVDETLNLEGLAGQLLPVAAPFDIYRFRGHAFDGSSVNIFGAIIGPWMYLRGGTEPPPEGAENFTYNIRALARSQRPFADLNDDGIVDAADYVMIRTSDDASDSSVATDASDSSVATYDDWVGQFGEVILDVAAVDNAMSAALSSSGSNSSRVPEPATLALVLLAGILFAVVRRC